MNKINSIKAYIKSSSILLSSQIIKASLAILISILFTRLTSAEIYGSYQFIYAVLVTLTIFSLPGMNSSMISEVVNSREGAYKKNMLISKRFSLLSIPIFLVISAIFFLKQNYYLSLAILISGLLSPLYYCYTVWVSYYQAKKLFKKIAVNEIILSISGTSLIIILLIYFPNQIIFLVISTLSLSILINYFIYKKSKKYIKNELESKDWKKYGFFLSLITLPRSLMSNIDLILVGIYVGIVEVAIYGVGTKIIIQLQKMLKVFLFTATPHIAKKNIFGKKEYLSIFLISLFVSLILIILLPKIIILLFTDSYSNSIIIAQIFSASIPFFILEDLYRKHIKFFLKNKKVQLAESLIAPSINLMLTIILLIFGGIVGLVIARSLKNLINLSTLYLFKKIIYNL